MGYNIEWMSDDRTEIWTYQGRLYQTYKAAKKQRDHWLKTIPGLKANVTKRPENAAYYIRRIQEISKPVYRLKLEWIPEYE